MTHLVQVLIHQVQILMWRVQALLLICMRTVDVKIHIAANESINVQVKDLRKPERAVKFDLNKRQTTVKMLKKPTL